MHVNSKGGYEEGVSRLGDPREMHVRASRSRETKGGEQEEAEQVFPSQEPESLFGREIER